MEKWLGLVLAVIFPLHAIVIHPSVFEAEKYGIGLARFALGTWDREHFDFGFNYGFKGSRVFHGASFKYLVEVCTPGWSEKERDELLGGYSTFKNDNSQKYKTFLDERERRFLSKDLVLLTGLKTIEKSDGGYLYASSCEEHADVFFAVGHKKEMSRIIEQFLPELTTDQRKLLKTEEGHAKLRDTDPGVYAFFLRRFRRVIEKEQGQLSVYCVHCRPEETHERCPWFLDCWTKEEFDTRPCELLLDEFQIKERRRKGFFYLSKSWVKYY